MTENPLANPDQSLSVVCAWCDRSIREGTSGIVSHGICLNCLGDKFHYPIENLASLQRSTADSLPYGFIRLDTRGVVLDYNTSESKLSGLPPEKVVGKNFFRTVAPCTCVKQFEGRVQEIVASGKIAKEQINFLFKFPGRVAMVNLIITYDPTRGEVVLLVRKVQQQPTSKPPGAPSQIQ